MPDLPDRLKAALAHRYRVEREIGRGGMAHVFLAHDLKLDRPVALKVLRPDLAAALGGDRFLREITLAANLEHPHILGIHDSGEADGVLYYVMPYVDGESLRDRLAREKQLPLDDALQISREVADALSYAHSRGVIHRDIKPENILLRSGHAVVADFGIARAVDAAAGDRLTETGVTLGTPTYMSPEQAAGGKDLDGRSDLYSLGCVLYEMLAGQPPFTGPTVESVIHQHITVEPRTVSDLRPAVPSWVVLALTRALAKTPADRFHPVAQFAEAIAPPVAVAEGPIVTPVAVAPTHRRRWGWAVAGAAVGAVALAGLIVAGLRSRRQETAGSALPALRPWVMVADFDGSADLADRRAARDLAANVLDQSTVAATLPMDQMRRGLELAGKPDTTTVTEAVARELAVRGGIGSVVTGQIDRVGSSYSVLVRLMRADSGTVLAAENRTAANADALIPAIGDAMRALLAQLGERRADLEGGMMAVEAMTPSFAAYRKYAEAVRVQLAEGVNSNWRELDLEALALDSNFAAAWVDLGWHVWQTQSDSEWAALGEARKHAERLTPWQRSTLEWVTALGRWHLAAARQFAEQGVRERPNVWPSWNFLAIARWLLGDPAAALEVWERASALDVFGGGVSAWNRTLSLMALGRRGEAREMAETIRNPVVRLRARLDIAELDGAWTELDSLGPLWERAQLESGAGGSGHWRTTLHLVRGEVRAAKSEPERNGDSALPLLWELATGAPVIRVHGPHRDHVTQDDWDELFEAALAGDTALARAGLPRLTADSLDYRVQSGYWRAAVEAAIASQRGDWSDVIRQTGPLVRDRPALDAVMGAGSRWLTARAYERLDRLDSAEVLLSELVEPGRLEVSGVSSFPYGAANSYLRQHLIVLLARMGRVADAERQWKIFQAAFTNPDPEYRPLLDEARGALEAAERKSR